MEIIPKKKKKKNKKQTLVQGKRMLLIKPTKSFQFELLLIIYEFSNISCPEILGFAYSIYLALAFSLELVVDGKM